MPYQRLDPTTAAAAPAVTLGAPLSNQEETLGSLREELSLLMGQRDDVTPDRFDRWINDAYRTLASMLDIEELDVSFSFSTVADQPFYLLPPELSVPRRVSLIDTVNFLEGGQELELSDESEYRKLADSTLYLTSISGLGIPLKWFRYGTMLVIWPTPVGVNTIAVDGKVRPRKMVLDTDSPILPAEWNEVLLLCAKSKTFRGIQEFENATLAWNDYLDELRSRSNTKAETATRTHGGLVPVHSNRNLRRRRGLR